MYTPVNHKSGAPKGVKLESAVILANYANISMEYAAKFQGCKDEKNVMFFLFLLKP